MHFARRHRAALELVTVWQPLAVLDSMAAVNRSLLEMELESHEADRLYMRDLAERVAEVVGSEVDVRYLSGQPASELARRAATGDIDLVVMSTHAHGPITRAFVGSVADRLARKSAIPLLIVRPSDSAAEVELTPSAHSAGCWCRWTARRSRKARWMPRCWTVSSPGRVRSRCCT